MKTISEYSRWLEKAIEDADLQTELISIKDDEDEIYERFYKNLEFGTGGLRGVIGAGTNRVNIYTIRQATQGLASYILKSSETPSVAIAYDSRIKSDRFARETASVLAANGIHIYIYKELMPTPMLSFAVRELKCDGGVVITASHNPSKYNGYKAYGADGCQMTLSAADQVLKMTAAVDCFDDVRSIPFEQGLESGMIEYIGQEVIDSYYNKVLEQSVSSDLCPKSGLKIVYTPLCGAGNKPVRTILKKIGINDVVVVPEQELPDGNFPTCPYPNPEAREALEMGLKLSKEVKPDLLLATDPDGDRVGIAVPSGDGYELLSGNEVGAMLLEYICSQRSAKGTMPKNPVTIKTIVTTDIINAIANNYNVEVIETLTGFKFIGEQITILESRGEESRYIFGFEESYGYLAGTYVRDKDAIAGAMMICEMAAYYRTKGISMIQAREMLYEKYGMYMHEQKNFVFEGSSGMAKMKGIMDSLRESMPKEIGGLKVIYCADYLKSIQYDILSGTSKALTLPKSDVISFDLEDGAKVIVRPSGTEPKLKAYYTALGVDRTKASELLAKLEDDFENILAV